MSHYDTLGLPRTASPDEIVATVASLRAAVVLDHDTDRFLMTELDEAEFVLTEPTRRAVYDASLPPDPVEVEARRRRRLVSAIIWSVPLAFALALVVWTVTGSALAGRLVLFGVLTAVPLLALVAARR